MMVMIYLMMDVLNVISIVLIIVKFVLMVFVNNVIMDILYKMLINVYLYVEMVI
jgi:hypothetical protein